MTVKTIHGTYSGDRTLKIAYGGSRTTEGREVNIEASTTHDTYYDGIELRDALLEAFPLPVPEDASPEEDEPLPPGTIVRVTGDSFEPGAVGTVGRLMGKDDGYPRGRGYRVTQPGSTEHGHRQWDVHEDDIEVLAR